MCGEDMYCYTCNNPKNTVTNIKTVLAKPIYGEFPLHHYESRSKTWDSIIPQFSGVDHLLSSRGGQHYHTSLGDYSVL